MKAAAYRRDVRSERLAEPRPVEEGDTRPAASMIEGQVAPGGGFLMSAMPEADLRAVMRWLDPR